MLPEVGVTEAIVIAAIALIVVGPKDLPVLMRKVGQFLGRMRAMASEFRSSFDELARQSELEDLKREVEAMRQERYDAVMGMGVGNETFDEIEARLNDRPVMDPEAAADEALNVPVAGAHPYETPTFDPPPAAAPEPQAEEEEDVQPSLFPVDPLDAPPHPTGSRH